MAISSPDRKVELMYLMIEAISKEGLPSSIQLGILKDTWLAEFGEEVPTSLLDTLEIIKKATL
jgi:hypothetical protein